MTMWRIEFTSADFLPALPEACQGNPGVYGFELAWWLAQELSQRGVVTCYPLGEDWGWLIEYANADGVEVTIGCSSLADEHEGYLGKPIQWSIFLRPYVSLKDRLSRVTHSDETELLGNHILAALGSRGITANIVER